MKKTKIVCTLGPASDDIAVLEKIISSGMDVARLNFSHGNHEEHKARFDAVKAIGKKLNKPVAIMLDTKGPEIRIKQFKNGSINLNEGDMFILSCEDVPGDQKRVSVTYSELYKEVKKGEKILIDDGLIKLTIKDIKDRELYCVVENGGELKNNKSMNIPEAHIKLPSLTQKDIDDIVFGIENDVDFIAASFIRSGDDVLKIRKALEDNGGSNIKIIAKIENRSGVNNIDEIIELSDGVMVARGDLGVEIPAEEVPVVQKHIIRKCNIAGKPVITATQMLDSMIRNPRPTRAEVGDVANAIFDGSDAVMLSGETAAGKYPAEAVQTMAKIAQMAENNLDTDAHYPRGFKGEANVTNTIGYASYTTAEALNAAAIVTPTSSGYTARTIAKFRPDAKIIAVMDKKYVQKQLQLSWGVETVLLKECVNFEQVLNDSLVELCERKILKEGDLVVITAGLPLNVKGTTNSIRVETVGHFVLRGKGIGRQTAKGKLRILREGEAIEIRKGDIVALTAVNEEILKQLNKAAGLITTQRGVSSEAAVAAIKAGIPAVVGVPDIEAFPDGSVVEIDPQRNMAYRVVKNKDIPL